MIEAGVGVAGRTRGAPTVEDGSIGVALYVGTNRVKCASQLMPKIQPAQQHHHHGEIMGRMGRNAGLKL